MVRNDEESGERAEKRGERKGKEEREGREEGSDLLYLLDVLPDILDVIEALDAQLWQGVARHFQQPLPIYEILFEGCSVLL